MPQVGDTVSFWFVHTSECFPSCAGEDDCNCISKRFVNRPAKVLAVYIDDGSSARDTVARIDAALAQSDVALVADVDPTNPNAETAAQRRARYKAAREEISAKAEELAKAPLQILDLDVQFIESDIADLGMQREEITITPVHEDGVPVLDETGQPVVKRETHARPLSLQEAQELGLPVHCGVKPASKKPPEDQHESGTWSE